MLEELTGYPYRVSGPWQIDEGRTGNSLEGARESWGWSGGDTEPTGAEWLCNLHSYDPSEVVAIVLMEGDEPPTDLPAGWTAEAYEPDQNWSEDDGTWIVKVMSQKGDGSWIFAGYCH